MLRGPLAALALAATVGFAAAAQPDELCPRGQYSIRKGAGGENTLRAVVKLPTAGYKVELKPAGERMNPPLVNLVCTRPTGMAAQVVTTYTATLDIKGRQRWVEDARGRRLVKMAAMEPAPKCKSNADCSGDGEFCDTTPACGPKAPGRCVKKPETCPDLVDPVQGCDGKTYSNGCKAVSEGMSVKGRTLY